MSLPGIDADPGRGDTGAIASFAGTFTARAAAAQQRQTDATGALAALEPVTADSVDALRPRLLALGQRFGEAGQAGGEIAAILVDYGAQVDSLQVQARTLLAHAQSDFDMISRRRAQALNEASEFVVGWALSWDEVLPAWMYADNREYLTRWQDAIDAYRSSRSAYNALQSTRDDLDRSTASRLRAIALVQTLTRNGALSAAALPASAAIWADDTSAISAASLAALADPALIRQVWNGLDAAHRDELIATAPLVIGNLNGIPLRDRITANRINIDNEIAAREAAISRWEQQRDAATATAYHSQGAIEKYYAQQIAEEQSTIDYYRSLLTQQVTWWDSSGVRHTDDGARVVVFDPRIQAIATYQGAIDPHTGDIPDWVRNVAVSVPGTGSNMTGFADDRGSDLYRAAGRYSAVFQWAGGAFPQEIPAATDPSYSHALAEPLRDFAAGISTPDGAKLTVLGHSYGGAVVGLAEQAGLRADRVLYVSAAGMGEGVSGVDDFPYTADAPHYSLMARNDTVVGLIQGREGEFPAIHGQSALTADGVVRLETGWIDGSDPNSTDLEEYNVPGNWMPPAIDSHSSVFTPGSTAFDNIVAVITGGEAVRFAPTQITNSLGGPISTDGIDASGYTPDYIQIE